MSYWSLLALDLTIVVVCIGALARFGRLRYAHPAVTYLFFHLYTFTLRLYALAEGGVPLFAEEGWGAAVVEPVRDEEFERAILVADLALVAMTVGWLLATRSRFIRDNDNHGLPKREPLQLDKRVVWAVAVVCFPVGIYALLNFAYVPGVERTAAGAELGEWRESSYITVAQSWPGLVLLALIYVYGFRWSLLLPMFMYLGIIGLQGGGRMRMLLPSIMMVQIWLDRARLNWPPLRVLALLAVLGISFYPMKMIGRAVQNDASLEELAEIGSDKLNDALMLENGDQKFFDQMSCALTLVDRRGVWYLGEMYGAVATLWIPRQLWPEKPGLADYIEDISTRTRPMGRTGMVTTYIGESYANFRYLGVVASAFGLGILLASFHFRAYSAPFTSILRFTYLMMCANLIQVFRDGLTSVVVFTAVHMMPLALVVLAHFVLNRGGARTSMPIDGVADAE